MGMLERRDGDGTELDSAIRGGRPRDRGGLERELGLNAIFEATGLKDESKTTIGGFEVIRKLGAGAMGTVFEARDPELDRLVAIKLLKGESEEERDANEGIPHSTVADRWATDNTIQREARALARLNHPNVVSVYSAGETGGRVFIAMEHVPGGNLRRWLRDHPPDRWNVIVELFVQAGRGLVAAHEAGIIHRDFKPDNVLIDARGVAKVADFGLARLEMDSGAGVIDGHPYVVGTRAYMAPEIIAGVSATPQSDQYSFCACLLAELSRLGGSVPVNVRAALTRGMRDDVEERWSSLEQLVDVLERALAHPSRDRHRAKLLERVQRIWIEGMLEASLGGRRVVSLKMSDASELVDSPWEHGPLNRQRMTAKSLRSDQLPELFERSNGALLIVGAPGSGKTTALLECTRALLETARIDPSAAVPVVLNLSSYTGRGPLAQWIESELVNKYRLPRTRISNWLESDDLVLVLDGLDELSTSRRGPCVDAINEFRRERAVPLLVACREDEYLASQNRLALGGAVRLCPLDEDAVREWGLETRVGDLDDERLRTPLWFALAGGGKEITTEHSWDTIYEEYVARALAAKPTLDAGSRARWKQRLRWLAWNMARNKVSDVWLERMQYSWLPGFGRQALAMALGTLAMAVLIVTPCILASLFVGRSALSGFTIGFGGLVIALAFNRGLRVKTGEKLRWSLRTSLRRLPFVVALGSGVGLFYALSMGRPIFAMLYLGATGGLVLGAILGLDYSERTRGIRPSDGLRTALWQAIIVTLFSSIVTGLAYGLVISPIYGRLFPSMLDAYPGINVSVMHGVTLGTVIGCILGSIYGGAAVALHGCYRLVLFLTSPMPLRLIPWLDDATQRGLLRRVGGGYMFMHATLLESLARQTGKPLP
jgi:serine/threonine protein kinase